MMFLNTTVAEVVTCYPFVDNQDGSGVGSRDVVFGLVQIKLEDPGYSEGNTLLKEKRNKRRLNLKIWSGQRCKKIRHLEKIEKKTVLWIRISITSLRQGTLEKSFNMLQVTELFRVDKLYKARLGSQWGRGNAKFLLQKMFFSEKFNFWIGVWSVPHPERRVRWR